MKEENARRPQAPLAAITVATVLSLPSGEAAAKVDCYGFDGAPVGTVYALDDAIDTRHSTVSIQRFLIDGEPSGSAVQEVEIAQSALPNGPPPSLKITSAVVQVRPRTPVRTITFDYAENTGADDRQRQNFGVNGQRLTTLEGGLAQLDGRRLGRDASGGRAQVSVTGVPDGDALPTWVRGTVTITALDQGISHFATGAGSQFYIDNVCLSSD